ncbi:Ankyrin repeat-containing protein [Mucilaginibacter gossypiicola]|uniref:Ankyrin repeat-containing protein n=1 Tax=Mucilaginibacter gossypiicola TaxID=551995 RepID=A0A1H8MXF3_9SPHI|nr:ankyrin repeat domain-containing protein [Mucilaginibacter gossypiicola]SEO21953.1 Ankyrin repeat-containing protein [Mucilaginibacter gossypiicola]
MKQLILLLVFILSGFCVKAQAINEQLYKAVNANDTTLAETLINKGADVNFKRKVMNFEMSLLMLSVQQDQFKMVKLLVDHKVEIDWKDWFGCTALMYAANKGNVNIISYLLKNGADVHFADKEGNTVLSAAKEGNHPDAIKLIEDNLK